MALTNDLIPQFLPKCFTPYKSPTNVGTTLICVPTAAFYVQRAVNSEGKVILVKVLELYFRIVKNNRLLHKRLIIC